MKCARKSKLRPGMFVDPPATLCRKPTAQPTLSPDECIAIALTATEWKPEGVVDPDGLIVQSIRKSLRREGYKIVPMERADYE